MNTNKSHSIKIYIIRFLTVFTSVFPISLSAAVFMGFSYSYCALMAAVPSVFFTEIPRKKSMPSYAAFLIMMYAALSFGTATLSLAAFVCGIISVIFYLLPKQFKIRDNPVTSGLMLAAAITVTVLLTTHYFGIGATGNNVKEMISSYLSLGFHPNWRGVLYGTVVMVIMITFPRKFKKLCSIVKAPFIAIVVTHILNLFLNPTDMQTAINEIGDAFTHDISSQYISFFTGGELNIPAAILCGISLFFVCNYALTQTDAEKTDCVCSSIFNTVSGTAAAAILPYGIKTESGHASNMFFMFAVLLISEIFLPDGLGRIPVHSLAVVMIVGAWESVNWREIKNAFSSPVSIICFIASAVSCLYFGFVYGILISAALYVVYHLYSKNKSKAAEISG